MRLAWPQQPHLPPRKAGALMGKRRCYRMRDQAGNVTGMMCGDLGPKCFECGSVADVLCDFPLSETGKTCDKALCLRCAPEVGVNKNFCAEHRALDPGLLLFRRPETHAEEIARAKAVLD